MFIAPATGTWVINMISAEPYGEEQTNVTAVYATSANADFKRTLTFNNLALTAYDTSGIENITITLLQIQYKDTEGQVPYAIRVMGSYVGNSEVNTTFRSGHFQNGVINDVYTTSLILSNSTRFNLKFRIQGQHV